MADYILNNKHNGALVVAKITDSTGAISVKVGDPTNAAWSTIGYMLTSAMKTKLDNAALVQPDWNATTFATGSIKNRPVVGGSTLAATPVAGTLATEVAVKAAINSITVTVSQVTGLQGLLDEKIPHKQIKVTASENTIALTKSQQVYVRNIGDSAVTLAFTDSDLGTDASEVFTFEIWVVGTGTVSFDTASCYSVDASLPTITNVAYSEDELPSGITTSNPLRVFTIRRIRSASGVKYRIARAYTDAGDDVI